MRIECVPCGSRVFSNKEALMQHLKTSSAWHPMCEKCDKRFSSAAGLDAHITAKHPPTFDCGLCDRSYRHQFALEDHYRGSPNHPNCPRCGKGFRDDSELNEHRATAHPKIRCEPCNELVYEDQDSLQKHYATSSLHPTCPKCNRGCRDTTELESHGRTHCDPSANPPASGFTNSTIESSQSTASAPSKFPLLEASSPVERVTADPQFPGTSRPWSPPMSSSSLHWHGAAALLDTKPLTPLQSLSGRAPSTTSLAQQVIVSRHVPNLVAHRSETPLERTGFTPLGTTRGPFRPLGAFRQERLDTPPLRLSMAFSSPLMKVQAPSLSPVSGLMPPSDQANEIWQAKENRQISQKTTTSPPKLLPMERPWSDDYLSTSSRPQLLAIEGPAQAVGTPLWPPPPTHERSLSLTSQTSGTDSQSSSTGRLERQSASLNWHNLMQGEDAPTETATPTGAETPSPSRKPALSTSPAFSSTSFESVRHTDASFDIVSSKTSNCSNLTDDVCPLEISETQLPLPPSPPLHEEEEEGDLGITVDIQGPDAVLSVPEVLSTFSSPGTGSGSFITSPQDPINSPPHEPSPLSPCPAAEADLPSGTSGARNEESEVDQIVATTSTVAPLPATALSPLHCRECKADPCKDITATMCGHIFCYGCITDAVIKSNKCPVCSTPTLLYCLFRLDLSV